MDKPIISAERLEILRAVCIEEVRRIYPTDAERNAMVAWVVEATVEICAQVGAPAYVLVTLMDLEAMAEKVQALYDGRVQ